MDHYAPRHELATHTWRTRTMVVSAVAAVEFVALIALALLLFGKGWFQHERATRVAEARQSAAAAAEKADTKTTRPVVTHKPAALQKPLLTRAHTGVLVLNGNGRDGAAGAEATVLRQHGYPVAAVGNAKRSDYAASIVMYRPGYDREARRFARDLKIPIVGALDGLRVSQLEGARLLLIIGR